MTPRAAADLLTNKFCERPWFAGVQIGADEENKIPALKLLTTDRRKAHCDMMTLYMWKDFPVLLRVVERR